MFSSYVFLIVSEWCSCLCYGGDVTGTAQHRYRTATANGRRVGELTSGLNQSDRTATATARHRDGHVLPSRLPHSLRSFGPPPSEASSDEPSVASLRTTSRGWARRARARRASARRNQNILSRNHHWSA